MDGLLKIFDEYRWKAISVVPAGQAEFANLPDDVKLTPRFTVEYLQRPLSATRISCAATLGRASRGRFQHAVIVMNDGGASLPNVMGKVHIGKRSWRVCVQTELEIP
ncbi:MAG: hypothetical protein ACQEUM_13620 [Pseudomonadota bacterium]